MIPHSKPSLGREEIEAVNRVIESGFISQGEQVRKLEDEFAEFLGLKHAVAVSSGTAGLHLALLALGIDGQSKVHIPSYVCTALLNAVNYCSAEPDICDVHSESGNIDLEDFKKRIDTSSRAVIIPHMFGNPCDIKKIGSLEIPIIEDCAQSVGAEIDGIKVGTSGNLSVFSFYATKVLSAGEGGMIASNSSPLVEIIRDLRDYDHKTEYLARYNYKMTDIQAALARSQLLKLPSFIQRRREIAKEYDKAVLSSGFRNMERPAGDIYFRYILFSDDIHGKLRRFRDQGVTAASPVFRPIHRYLDLKGYRNTEKIHKSAISLPCYPALKDEEVEQVCQAILTAGATCSAAR